MSLPVTANFTGSDGNDLVTINTNFSTNSGTFTIISNAVYCSASNALVRWNADTFADNQYCQMKVNSVGVTSGFHIGPACRCATGGAQTAYSFQFETSLNTVKRRLVKTVTGTNTILATDTTLAVVGQIFKLKVIGTQLEGQKDGTTVLSISDSAISSGSGGIFGVGSYNLHTADDWEAGDLGSSSSSSSKSSSSSSRSSSSSSRSSSSSSSSRSSSSSSRSSSSSKSSSSSSRSSSSSSSSRSSSSSSSSRSSSSSSRSSSSNSSSSSSSSTVIQGYVSCAFVDDTLMSEYLLDERLRREYLQSGKQ